MRITHQKGRGSKIHLLLDGEYQITTDALFWAENGFPDGTDIDEVRWEKLVGKINEKKALNKCAQLLSLRDHSVKELRIKLLHTVDPDSADKAIKKMLELGYLNDYRFAEHYIRHLSENKKYSVSHIRHECYQKGISGEIIDELLAQINIDPVSSITELIKKKYTGKLNTENGKEKVIATFMRKGFTYSDIQSALSGIENE